MKSRISLVKDIKVNALKATSNEFAGRIKRIGQERELKLLWKAAEYFLI